MPLTVWVEYREDIKKIYFSALSLTSLSVSHELSLSLLPQYLPEVFVPYPGDFPGGNMNVSSNSFRYLSLSLLVSFLSRVYLP